MPNLGQWRPFRWLRQSCARMWELYRSCLEANLLLRPWMRRKAAPPTPPSNESFADRLWARLLEKTSSAQTGVGLAVAATVAMLVATGYWYSVEFSAVDAPRQVISTGVNETTRQALSDGSELSVKERSTLTVDETGPQRVARLEAGEILFKVKATPLRPFIVDTAVARASVDADATFRVAIGRSVEVEVYEGEVKVVKKGAKADAPARWLLPGESMSVPLDRTRSVLADRHGSVSGGARIVG